MMPKKQIGLRIDRILYDRFLNLCVIEKLRPGEAVEQLIKLVVDNGSVSEVYAKAGKPGRVGQAVDEVMFKSHLSRLKATLEYERTRLETGGMLDENERTSDQIIRELAEICRRSVDEELIREFQTVLTEADRLYEKSEKQSAEDLIDTRKPRTGSLTQESMPRDGPREVRGG